MSHAQTFLKAAELIDRAPRLARGLYERDGCYCIAGAIYVASGYSPTGSGAEFSAAALVRDILDDTIDLVKFNDDESTTKQHAVLLLLFLRAMEQQ